MEDPKAVLPWIHPVNMVLLGSVGVLSVVLTFLFPKGTTKEGRKHAVITGGSSGIGLALAKECVRAGFENVTIVARGMEKLAQAKSQLGDSNIHTVSLDITNAEKVREAAEKIVEEVGPPDVLYNNAGSAVAKSFDDLQAPDFTHMMETNYLGSVYMTKAFLPAMKKNGGGTIVYTSSMAGQCGVFGYTAYTPAKFALRGFAESLQMEVRRDNVSVVLTFPPDTDTPGFAQENIGKPQETHLISEAAGLYDPNVVAKTIAAKTLTKNPPFCVYFGLEGWMLSTISAGMSPVHGLVDALCQVLLTGLLRFISLFYLWDFTRIIEKCGKKNKANSDDKIKAE